MKILSFINKKILSDEEVNFQIDTYRWLLKNFNQKDYFQHRQLVLPIPEYFPAKVHDAYDVAFETFIAVKKHAGMESMPCKLRMQEEDINPYVSRELILQGVDNSPLGTFGYYGGSIPFITFNPELVERPESLVATFAHEFGHYLTGRCAFPPPGGWENEELVTDIAATYMGFGVFMANSSFSYQQFGDGWQTRSSGYLSVAAHVHALALFLYLKDISTLDVSRYLKPSLNSLLRKSYNQIRTNEKANELLSLI